MRENRKHLEEETVRLRIPMRMTLTNPTIQMTRTMNRTMIQMTLTTTPMTILMRTSAGRNLRIRPQRIPFPNHP